MKAEHDWPAVLAALQDLKDETEKNEPWAVSILAALEEVLASLPEDAFR